MIPFRNVRPGKVGDYGDDEEVAGWTGEPGCGERGSVSSSFQS